MRAIIAVLDSFGIGAAPDAARFGDAGANTFGHIAAACVAGRADNDRRRGTLNIPNLLALGLGLAAREADAAVPIMPAGAPTGRYGAASEISKGKDTPSGHWEMMGLPVEHDWGYFPVAIPTFPKTLTDAFIAAAGVPGILGNCHASGTEILDQLGEEHIRTGKPICYTSADSVFQIAAHESHFGLERLYEISRTARKLVDPYNVGRVIARPFVGEKRCEFQRTYNRHDYTMPPHRPTLLDVAKAEDRDVIGIGKVSDIFAGRGITSSIRTEGNDDTFAQLVDRAKTAPDGSITFANFVDFDQSYGHRRDVAGYAGALEDFDAQIPVIAFGPGIAPGPVGKRASFADIGQSIAAHLGLPALAHGTSFL